MSDPVRPPTRLLRPWDSPGQEHWSGLPFLSPMHESEKWKWSCSAQGMKVKSESEVAQSCPTLCDPIDGSPPGSSVSGILQATILEWVVTSFPRRSFQSKDWICISCASSTDRQILYHWVNLGGFIVGKKQTNKWHTHLKPISYLHPVGFKRIYKLIKIKLIKIHYN